MSSSIGIFSFFAGAGFLDLGFETTGAFRSVFVNEIHKPFLRVYEHSRKQMGIKPPTLGYQRVDIAEYLATTYFKEFFTDSFQEVKSQFDMIGFVGGPPCPDFSIAGKNKGRNGENGKLSKTYIDLICHHKPDFFLFENVKGLYRTKKHSEFFQELKSTLVENGYYLTEQLINAIEFGVPQDRERIILIGFRHSILGDLGFKLNGSPIIKNFDWNYSKRYRASEVFALDWAQVEPFEANSLRIAPENLPLDLTVEHWFKVNNVERHPNAEHHFIPRAGLSKFQTIPEGDDAKKSYKRLHRWRYSPTAAYGNNEVHLHPYKERRISAAEALAIQSLPKEFSLPDVSLSDMFKTIGNGVPFLAAQGLAKNIIQFLFHNPIKDLKVDYEKVNGK